MHLSRAESRSFDRSNYARARIARTGVTCLGHAVWTKDECELLRQHYPDYAALQRLLPRRTLHAIKNQAKKLDVASRRHIWTNLEILKLRSLYARKASNAALLDAFPGLRLRQIQGKAWHIKAPSRRHRPFKVFGVPALDAVRAKANEHAMTLRDLDALARTRRYFQSCTRRPVWKHINRAVQLFEGTLVVDWSSIDQD